VHDPNPRHERLTGDWVRVSKWCERREPDFPIAAEVAARIADHHAAQLPMGYEAIPIINPRTNT